ncbi:histidine phosphatase family protein [Longispora albida]|uniref:histidine phosphatase family protein n=1 Tax=Longispora albida TaxID=203523 RepID=UPI000360D53D|nr:histidine phosphatase family protein [Longispora albida]
MTRLILWRHGQTEWNSSGRMQGQTDIALDATGRAQAAAAAEVLARLEPSRIVASDLRRAFDTASYLGERTGLPVASDKRLRERGFGEWEAMRRVEVAEKYPDSWALWMAGKPLTGHGIESWDEVGTRMLSALLDAVEGAEGVVVVTGHGGSIRRGIDLLLAAQGFEGRFDVLGNCHWADLRLSKGEWRISGYNVAA